MIIYAARTFSSADTALWRCDWLCKTKGLHTPAALTKRHHKNANCSDANISEQKYSHLAATQICDRNTGI